MLTMENLTKEKLLELYNMDLDELLNLSSKFMKMILNFARL